MSVYGIPDEVYLRNRLDRLNQNSHYGIMIDTEITDIVRRHIKRLEDNKMKATSTETFHDIIAIDFELQTFPNPDVQDKFIVSATNRDDIFAFVFEGPNIVDACRKTGLFADWEKDQKIRELEKENEKLKTRISIFTDPFTGWDKNQKIRELEEENKNLKKHIKRHADNCRTIAKRNDELRKDLALEKAANEAQHKFIREYAGKGTEVQFNYAIDDAKEVSYVVVDKEEYNKNFEKWANAQVENAPVSTSREDILDQAKKCVCGQREQDYGTPENNFQLIADLWNGYLFPSLKENKPVISATDVSMMMALMKIARIKNGGGSGDSFVDLAGYAACGGEIWHGQKVKDQN